MNKRAKSSAEGLVVSRGRSDKRSENQGKNISKIKGFRSKSRGKSQPKARECWVCGKEGHFKRDCPERKHQRATSSANVAQEKEYPMILTASVQDTKQEWVLDSGCTFHITPNKEVLFDLEEFDGGKVLMGNNTISEVKGIGKLKIVNHDQSTVVLTGVRYMP